MAVVITFVMFVLALIYSIPFLLIGADETFKASHGYLDVHRGGRQIKPSDLIVRTLAVGAATAKVGMAMTGEGETHPACDIAADGDNSILGILYKPVVRPSDTWDIDDALADAQDVVLLKPTGGELKIAVWLTGLTTGDGAVKAGEAVYIVDMTPAGIAGTNLTPGALMAVVTGTGVQTDAGLALPFIGRLVSDVTIADSGGAAVGIVAEIWY